MSEQLSNRALLRLLCQTDQSADLIADRIEELQRENAALRTALRTARRYVHCASYEGPRYAEVAETVRKDRELIDTLLAKEDQS